MEISIAGGSILPGVAPALPAEAEAPPDPRLEHELRLVASAVALVEANGAPRVTVVGMRSGRQLVTRALAMGASAGILVRARWWADEDAFDLVVERHG